MYSCICNQGVAHTVHLSPRRLLDLAFVIFKLNANNLKSQVSSTNTKVDANSGLCKIIINALEGID